MDTYLQTGFDAGSLYFTSPGDDTQVEYNYIIGNVPAGGFPAACCRRQYPLHSHITRRDLHQPCDSTNYPTRFHSDYLCRSNSCFLPTLLLRPPAMDITWVFRYRTVGTFELMIRGGSSFLPRGGGGGGGVDPVADPGFSKNRAVLLFYFFSSSFPLFSHLAGQGGGGGGVKPNPLDPPLMIVRWLRWGIVLSEEI